MTSEVTVAGVSSNPRVSVRSLQMAWASGGACMRPQSDGRMLLQDLMDEKGGAVVNFTDHAEIWDQPLVPEFASRANGAPARGEP